MGGPRRQYPNIVISFDEGYMQDWYNWFKDASVNQKITRRTGAISWYAPDMKDRELIAPQSLDGVGVLLQSRGRSALRGGAKSRCRARQKATLFVETMTLQPGVLNGNV